MDLLLAILGTGPGLLVVRYWLIEIQIWLIKSEEEKRTKKEVSSRDNPGSGDNFDRDNPGDPS